MSSEQTNGGAARSLRRVAARFVLATPPLRQAFLRVAFDEDMLSRILEDPIFLHRVLHAKPVTGRLANVLDNPAVFQHFLSSNRVQDRLLDDETFHGRLAEENALLLAVAMRSDVVPKFIDSPEALKQFLSAPSAAQRIAADAAFVKRLVREPMVIDAIAADKTFIDTYLRRSGSSPEFIKALVAVEGAISLLASQPEIKKHLSELPSRADELAKDVGFLRRLLNSENALAAVSTDEEVISRLLTSERVIRRFAADAVALNSILSQSRSRDAILADARLFGGIMNDDRAVASILHDATLLQRLAPRGEMINAMLANPQASRTLFEDQRAIDVILSNDHLLKRITPRAKALATFVNDPAFVDHLAESSAVVEKVLQRKTDARLAKKLKALAEFDDAWARLMPFAAPGTDLAQRAADARATVNDVSEVPAAILELLCEGDRIHLPGATLEVPDRRSLWVVLHEILLEEEYYFETRAAAPRILDCGSHFGLAIYYFKRLYPESRITAFEPLPRLREMAQRNIDVNNLRGVELLPYALNNLDGQTTFHISESDSMAGSLTERRRETGDHVVPLTVECRKLSAWLDEPVHFLKLDIEGSEDVVLEEVASKLQNVQHIFCEYHHGAGLDSTRLPKILNILNDAGFDTHMGKSHSYQQATHMRPMKHVSRPYSLVIWAKNRNWS